MFHLNVSKEISFHQQQQFAALSGDFNPIHVNPGIARRELFGEIVVHGMHLVLSALDMVISQNKTRKPIIMDSVEVKFFSPALVSTSLIFGIDFDEKLIKVEIRDAKKSLLSEMMIAYRVEEYFFDDIKPESFMEYKPDDIDINKVSNLEGQCDLYLNMELRDALFPALSGLADIQLAEMLVMTRIVGMKCPGKQSLFSALSIFFKKSDNRAVSYFVKNIVKKFSMVTVGVVGPSLKGELSTFIRPEPARQPSIDQISTNIQKNTFKCIRALIIGGSRGIGETTAKIIAAGGGKTVITYNLGKVDAENVCKEITDAGFSSEYLKMDIENFNSSVEAKFLEFGFNAVFYYPSPKILRSNTFDTQLFNKFLYYYVEQFENLIRQIRSSTAKNVVVFYPSTINITEKTQGFTEYIMSKMAGEYLCESLTRDSKHIKILVERLPRLQTDQTMSLQNYPADSTSVVMLPIILRINEIINRFRKSDT